MIIMKIIIIITFLINQHENVQPVRRTGAPGGGGPLGQEKNYE